MSRIARLLFIIHCSFATGFVLTVRYSSAQVAKAPLRKAGEGDGPYNRLLIRGVTLINSTGAPPVGPVDIVVEKNRIAQIRQVGYPGAGHRPERPTGGRRGR